MAKSKRGNPPKPVWKGPEEDGITQSLLQRFLVCRERFRVQVIEGLQPVRRFDHRSFYGDCWHLCEESYSDTSLYDSWKEPLLEFAKGAARRYPESAEQVDHWYRVCKITFPVYLKYWSEHQNTVKSKPLLKEQVFNVPYELPSGRVVRLKGKWDLVELFQTDPPCIYLWDHKTKGDVREGNIQRQLRFDIQTMFYVVAYQADDWSGYESEGHYASDVPPYKLSGIRYNVVRRPLSGGRHTIKRHKATKSKKEETFEAYYDRLKGLIESDPGYFFMRWQVELLPSDIQKFREQCLDPILEQLCDWYDWVTTNTLANVEWLVNGLHYRTPFGIWNNLIERGSDELDEYLETGSTVGLEKVSTLFPELE